ncbi:hypothetical protein MRB53_005329 [Persea americana]|uniref:Uncharacterized protein n=1 Tax=Persea americana TaxID=3435 RepID=A0ACC2MDW9_PERAE|nr:hypothetical protein MRB53_005329 [Persea americana]
MEFSGNTTTGKQVRAHGQLLEQFHPTFAWQLQATPRAEYADSIATVDEKQSPKCECPTGFSYLNLDNILEGCKPNFAAQSCNSNEFRNEKELFKMEVIPNTTWVLSDFEQYCPVHEGFCEDSCLNDCLCAVAIFDNETCLKKRLLLSNGRAGPSINDRLL